MTQATQITPDGQCIYRWYLHLRNGGRKITWAATSTEAWRKAEARGLKVRARKPVTPAPSPCPLVAIESF